MIILNCFLRATSLLWIWIYMPLNLTLRRRAEASTILVLISCIHRQGGYDEACEHEVANNTSCFLSKVSCADAASKGFYKAAFDSKRMLLKTAEIGIHELYPPTTSERGETRTTHSIQFLFYGTCSWVTRFDAGST